MTTITVARQANAAYYATQAPVRSAVFLGGTSGIGQGIAEVFAKHTKGNANIIIVGRNREAAEAIISAFPKPTIPNVRHEFVQCDATLMKNVQVATSQITSQLPKINFLFMSPGFMTLRGRNETVEGIDTKLAVHYYARWKFIDGLLPSLNAAKESGEDSKVLSVLAAGVGAEIDLDDLGLRKHFSVKNAAFTAPTYNDLMMEEYAARNPGISFVHSLPGAVATSLIHWSMAWVFTPFLTSIQDCGDFMLNGLTNSSAGPGRMSANGDDLGKKRYFGNDEQRKKLWEHTVEITSV